MASSFEIEAISDIVETLGMLRDAILDEALDDDYRRDCVEESLFYVQAALCETIGVDSPPRDEADADWREFLASHPELRGWIASYDPARYCYYWLPNEKFEPFVIAALRRSGPEGMTIREILAAMYGTLDEATTSDGKREEMARVTGCLRSLTCRRLVEQTRKRQGSLPALWRLAKDAGQSA